MIVRQVIVGTIYHESKYLFTVRELFKVTLMGWELLVNNLFKLCWYAEGC